MIGGLRAACEEMGATLIRSGLLRQHQGAPRCSTALFDATGELVMQAEHIPVHLGSMPDAVAAVLDEEHGRRSNGSSTTPTAAAHLPDITLVSPVSLPASSSASPRTRPPRRRRGPTPARCRVLRRLDEEGVVMADPGR